jgi:serine/threonine protein kinase
MSRDGRRPTCRHTDTRTRTCALVLTHTYRHTHALAHLCTHTHTHTSRHAYPHPGVHTDECVLTNVCVCVCWQVADWPTLSDEENEERFHQEVSIMWSLSFHPNVIKLLGYSDSPTRSIITRLYPTDLFRYLHTQEDKSALESHLLLHLGSGMVASMAAVHSMGIAHRDIKTPNFLLQEPRPGSPFPDPILCDFGISRTRYAHTHTHTETDTHRDRHTETDTHTYTPIHTQRQTHRDRHTQRQTHTETDTQRQTHTETDTQRQTHRDRHTHTIHTHTLPPSLSLSLLLWPVARAHVFVPVWQ